MIIVTGHIITNADNRAAIEAEAVAHCRRSRAEPGCIAHNCHYDIEHPERLVFVEKWVDAAALRAHFAVPESGAFVKVVSALSTEPPALEIYAAEAVSAAALTAG
ncbi:MAG: antibiotic biosynthesis monooxygenase [Sphingorhabdus sp.]